MDVDPSPPTEIPSQLGNFKLVTQVKLGYSPTQIVNWQSQETGLKVVWIDVEGESARSWGNRIARSSPPPSFARLAGPLVQGYFAFITEIFDDSGRPHTLEHAVFMGSEK